MDITEYFQVNMEADTAKSPMKDCIFCKIIEGTLPARMVYEDERIVAFWDANPAAPIHLLVVPRVHIATLNDIAADDTLLTHLGNVACTVARELGIADSGYRFMINVNRDGGQMVFHLHAHVVAGRDLGAFFINAAVGAAIVWRKLAGLFRR